MDAAIFRSRFKPRVERTRLAEECALPLPGQEQAALVSGTDNGIALPISQTGFARDDGRTH
jgi:hypothetical protein